jgi:hypothetical protein
MAEKHVVVEVIDDRPTPNGTDVTHVVGRNAQQLPPPAEPGRPQEMSPQELRRAEGDVIDDLFRADEKAKQRVGTIQLAGKQVRQFNEDGSPQRGEDGALIYGPLELRFRPLRQSEIDQERRRCARIWQIDEEGTRVNDIDPTEFSARLVARAMVPEDRERYLEDKRMWDRFGVGGPIDLLDAWLTAGELNQAGALVMQLSGMPLTMAVERFLSKPSNAAVAD